MRGGLALAIATACLHGGTDPAAAQETYPSDEICVQSILALHGYDPGPIDGILGQRTRDMAHSFAVDWRLDLPRLSGATAGDWCVGLTAAQRGAGQPLDPALTDGPDALGCVTDPPDGYARVITGMVDGDPVELRVSTRFGGAVGSLTWRGMEFLNIYDHGRQISYAWFLDDHGECLNPTEPGSASDLFAQTSTTIVHEICSDAANRLSTRISPAFWTQPGQSAFCDNGTLEAVNTELVSDDMLEKVTQIGYERIENVIVFDSTITLYGDHDLLRAEVPTAYLTGAFSARYRFDPRDGSLTPVTESMDVTAPWSFVDNSGLPAILASEDGAFALGAYTARPGALYQILHYESSNPLDETNKWNILFSVAPAPAGRYDFRTFGVIGTLEQVHEGMVALAALHPVDLTPEEGFVDRADCDWIAGWAWDPDAPDRAMIVDVFALDGDSRALVASVDAGQYRPDLEAALGDGGRHAFEFETDLILPDGGQGAFTMEVRASADGLRGTPLVPNRFSLDCPG